MFHARNEVIKILENKDYELFKGDCVTVLKDIDDNFIRAFEKGVLLGNEHRL